IRIGSQIVGIGAGIGPIGATAEGELPAVGHGNAVFDEEAGIVVLAKGLIGGKGRNRGQRAAYVGNSVVFLQSLLEKMEIDAGAEILIVQVAIQGHGAGAAGDVVAKGVAVEPVRAADFLIERIFNAGDDGEVGIAFVLGD